MPSENGVRAKLSRAEDATSSTIRNDPTFLTENEGSRARPQSAMVGRRALANHGSQKVLTRTHRGACGLPSAALPMVQQWDFA